MAQLRHRPDDRRYSISRPSRSARYSAASVRRLRALQRWCLCFGMGVGRVSVFELIGGLHVLVRGVALGGRRVRIWWPVCP
jgi:hypothetical protein